jgi:hypothetical protein
VEIRNSFVEKHMREAMVGSRESLNHLKPLSINNNLEEYLFMIFSGKPALKPLTTLKLSERRKS